MEKENNYTCAYCQQPFPIWDMRPINRSIEGKKFRVCDTCADAAQDSSKIVQCDACGEYFTSDVLHDEEICGHTFTACPNCGKDMVDCMTREEFEKEHQPCRYAVIVRSVDGSQRGYTVSVDGNAGIGAAFKKLADKVKLNHAASVTIAEILMDEDEF
ncbi:hypothetical protein [uncultured Oscillibacter sp.]|uniref:hypothetical protein n=1 Tax=uncultured Oscillibacter sp. TaxID=876091 RepID=UPI00261CC8B9|nr:hypothetical protein [uncultured Oscillibacter sp.]